MDSRQGSTYNSLYQKVLSKGFLPPFDCFNCFNCFNLSLCTARGIAMKPISVIIVEDHDLTRIGLRTMLNQQEGIEVIGEAREGNSGLKLLQSLRPDVAIVDVGLPGISGIELTQRFKQFQHEDDSLTTKILIMTMQDSEDTVLAAFAAGADSYCMKDTGTEQLIDSLHTTAKGNAWIDPAIAQFILEQSRIAYTDPNAVETAPKVQIRSLSSDDSGYMSTRLTERELDVLQLIVQGCSNEQIGTKLFITVGTVKTHVRNILNKLSVDDRTQAAVRALRSGLVS
jgi:DNA-binding NarL/FixJ family response regulator